MTPYARRPLSPLVGGPPVRSLVLALGLLCGGLFPRLAVADLDVVFVLDTTGSMSAEIREVQERVVDLAASLAEARAGERIRFGIVAYRDRGDSYVTKASSLTEDIGASHAFLASLSAEGGGDGPESVVAGLASALSEMAWDSSADADRQIFLIGDAPPHLDYGDEPTTEELIEIARRERIVVNTIGCRSLPAQGITFFRRLAYSTEGSYQHIGRLRASQPGALTDVMSRTAAIGREAVDRGEVVPAAWVRHSDAEATGILVRQGGPEGMEQSVDGEALLPCTLEIRLPPGLALGRDPAIRLGPGGLEAELDLVADSGEGGLDLFELATCPPISTPINVVLGGH